MSSTTPQNEASPKYETRPKYEIDFEEAERTTICRQMRQFNEDAAVNRRVREALGMNNPELDDVLEALMDIYSYPLIVRRLVSLSHDHPVEGARRKAIEKEQRGGEEQQEKEQARLDDAQRALGKRPRPR